MRKLVPMAVALALVTALVPAGAAAKTRKVSSSIAVDVNGIIDRHGSVSYVFGGELFAKDFTFKCMERRKVTLFRVDANGTGTPVGSDRTDFLGNFIHPLELPLDQIPGPYYATAPKSTVKSKQGKLKCLAARSDTILVQLPAALL